MDARMALRLVALPDSKLLDLLFSFRGFQAAKGNQHESWVRAVYRVGGACWRWNPIADCRDLNKRNAAN